MAKVNAICISEVRGIAKHPEEKAVLRGEYGIEGDAHAGAWHRQISILSAEEIDRFREKLWVDYGAFGENLVISGLDLDTLPIGARLTVGPALLEITQRGKECHSDCAIKKATGTCIMPTKGLFARVLRGGEIAVGEEVALTTPSNGLTAAVITLSDKGYAGQRVDKSGPKAAEMLFDAGYTVKEQLLLPDDRAMLVAAFKRLADEEKINLCVTTGGTGFSPRDITPEATMEAADRAAPGIAEAMRLHSLSITPRAMLSRAASALRGSMVMVNLPGSPKAVCECLEYILPALEHGIRIAAGLDGECAAPLK